MDADLQHDETILPRMLERMKSGEGDLVVGSRYVETDRLSQVAWDLFGTVAPGWSRGTRTA